MFTDPYPKKQANLGQTEQRLSVAGGGALLLFSILKGGRGRLPLALGGGYLLYRGLSGRDPLYDRLGLRRAGERGIHVARAITINRPLEEVYAHWRRFENLPAFMEHLEEVRELGEGHSYWTAKAPLGTSVSWEAELIEERPNERLSWRSLPESQVITRGTVTFKEAPLNFGTEVLVELTYLPPLGGTSGAALARLLGEEPDRQLHDDLRHLKQILEAGHVATIRGQSSGRTAEVQAHRQRGREPLPAETGGPAGMF